MSKTDWKSPTGRPRVTPPPAIQKMIEDFDIAVDSARVYVMPDNTEEKMAGGLLFVPDVAKGKNFKQGWIIATGPEAVLSLRGTDGEPLSYELRPGDKVTWGKYSGAVTDRLERDEKNVLVMNGNAGEGDILGLLSHGC